MRKIDGILNDHKKKVLKRVTLNPTLQVGLGGALGGRGGALGCHWVSPKSLGLKGFPPPSGPILGCPHAVRCQPPHPLCHR